MKVGSSGRRGTAALGVAVAAVAVTAGCGGSDSSSVVPADPVAAVAASYTQTTAARTAKLAIHSVVTTQGRTLNVDGSGATDFVKKTATLSETVPGSGTIEARSTGTVTYVKIPGLGAETGGKSWIKIDLNAVDPAFGQQVGSGSSDPTQGLALLRERAKSATKVGTEAVRGTSTTHYRAVIDVAAATRGYTPAVRKQIETSLGNRSEITEDVWIDAQGRVRRFGIPSFTTTAKDGTTVSISLTTDMYDYGTPVTVTVPPASDTFDGTNLAKSGLGG